MVSLKKHVALLYSPHLAFLQSFREMMQPYYSTDTATACKKSCFILSEISI